MNSTVIAVFCGLVAVVIMRSLTRRLFGTERNVLVGAPRRWLGLHRRLPGLRRHERTDWAAALDHVAAELRTGSSLSGAVSSCTAFEQLRRSISAGDSLADSLNDLVATATTGDVEAGDRRLAIGSLIAVARVGGSGGRALERTAETIRERNEAIAERTAQSAQARLSAFALSALPAVFAVWSVATDARVRVFLLGTVFGALCLAGGVLLNVAGWLWMKRLAKAAG